MCYIHVCISVCNKYSHRIKGYQLENGEAWEGSLQRELGWDSREETGE